MVENLVDQIQETKSNPTYPPRRYKKLCQKRVQVKDMCGNPTLVPTNGVLTSHDIKQFKGYSLHCVQYKLIMNALVRRSHRWCYRLKKEQRHSANAQKFLQVARRKLSVI